MFEAGSSWRKWDLHIHSPLSLLNNQYSTLPDGSPDWEAYISQIESVNARVIGITDYFTIDGYKKVLEFKAGGRLRNIDAIFPNIEFRLSNILASKKDGDKPRRLNFHVIFSNEVAPRDIEEHFLHDLDFFYEGSPQHPDQTRKLKVSNIEALGKKLLDENEQFRNAGNSAKVVGAMTTVVRHEQISEILTRDSRFRDKYLLVFPEELSNLIEWGSQDHVIRQGLLQKSDMVFSSNARTSRWCVGADPYKEGQVSFIKEFKSLKPCLHGSDAHALRFIARPCAKRGDDNHDCATDSSNCEMRFCWIKADPTFEGLKQLKYEPTDRVRIQQADPTPLKSNSCIAGFRIQGSTVNSELSLVEVNFPLSGGLVAVTGGKGAGKTAFVDLIASLFKDRVNSNDSNSFVRRIAKDGATFTMAVTFGDGELFEKNLTSNEFVERSKIVYIAQGELEEYIGENSDLDVYIRNLVFESPEVKNTVKTFEFEKLSRRVDEIQAEITLLHSSIEKSEKQTSDSILSATKKEKSQLEAESRDVDAKIPSLEARLSPEKVQIVTEKQTKRSALQARKGALVELSEQLARARQFLAEDMPRFNRYMSAANNLLRQLELPGQLTSLEYPETADVTAILAVVETELNRVVGEIEESEKELQGYEAEMREHARYLSRRNELAAKLAGIDGRLQAIELDRLQLETNRQRRNDIFGELLDTILQQQRKYSEIIAIFGSQKAEVLSDLDFKADIQFARNAFLSDLQDVLDNRQVEVTGQEGSPSEFQKLQDLYGSTSQGDNSAVADLVDETSRLSVELIGKIKKSQAITRGDLYRALYGTYLSVLPVVNYKKTSLSKLSLGQKATVLIKIYLAQGTAPIIIDSHDDHLDNEFIMDELVGAIRKAKTYRQVILASNNGNVVINSDAEQIIIAQRDQSNISYTAGSIENPVIRDRALKVLEGGADAFRKRQEKYRLES